MLVQVTVWWQSSDKPLLDAIIENQSQTENLSSNTYTYKGIFPWPTHSVESPSMVDPQWNIWSWGSKWNFHTVCWDVVGCEWGTTFVYFGITYVCFIPSRLPVFAVEPQYWHQDFLFLSKVSFEGDIKNLQKISCWFKILNGVCRNNIE